jgi:putative transcriptional regulator
MVKFLCSLNERMENMKVILDQTLKDKKMTQKELSSIIHMQESSLSKFICGKTTQINYSTLDKICTALECEVSDVLKAEHVDLYN